MHTYINIGLSVNMISRPRDEGKGWLGRAKPPSIEISPPNTTSAAPPHMS